MPQKTCLDSVPSTYTRIPAIVSAHLKMLVGNMLNDGGDEFFGGEDFEVFLLFPWVMAER